MSEITQRRNQPVVPTSLLVGRCYRRFKYLSHRNSLLDRAAWRLGQQEGSRAPSGLPEQAPHLNACGEENIVRVLRESRGRQFSEKENAGFVRIERPDPFYAYLGAFTRFLLSGDDSENKSFRAPSDLPSGLLREGLRDLGEDFTSTKAKRNFNLNTLAKLHFSLWSQVPASTDFDVVEKIASTLGAARSQHICQAEFSDLSSDQTTTLMPLLWRFVLDTRDSNNPSDVVAVGSAIRQYVAALDVNYLENVAELLDPGHLAEVPLQIELEIAKMAFRKIDANPVLPGKAYPRLSNRFTEMVQTYLSPRILPRDQYAAVTMLAIQALAVMRSPWTRTLIEPLNKSPFAWFRRQLHRRLGKTADSWRQRGIKSETVDELSSFIREIRAD